MGSKEQDFVRHLTSSFSPVWSNSRCTSPSVACVSQTKDKEDELWCLWEKVQLSKTSNPVQIQICKTVMFGFSQWSHRDTFNMLVKPLQWMFKNNLFFSSSIFLLTLDGDDVCLSLTDVLF